MPVKFMNKWESLFLSVTLFSLCAGWAVSKHEQPLIVFGDYTPPCDEQVDQDAPEASSDSIGGYECNQLMDDAYRTADRYFARQVVIGDPDGLVDQLKDKREVTRCLTWDVESVPCTPGYYDVVANWSLDENGKPSTHVELGIDL
jgi:hypothetical protein